MLPIALTTDMLAGTPFQIWLLRIFGAKIGKRVYIDHDVGISEFPYINIGDNVTINEGAALIAHSEQPDGRLSFKELHLDDGSNLLWSGYLVGGTQLPSAAILGSLSRPFDGQILQAGNEYNNTPCQRQGT